MLSVFNILFLSQLAKCEDLDNEVDEMVQEFEGQCQRPLLHTAIFC